MGIPRQTAQRRSAVAHGKLWRSSRKCFGFFTYDLDKNLQKDGRWEYSWNSLNQLEKMSLIPTATGTGKARHQVWAFVYDAQGRRVAKRFYEKFGADFAAGDFPEDYYLLEETLFFYDGWNLIAEVNGFTGDMKTYLWGTDLSGSFQGAGGVGGLLAIKDWKTNKTYAVLNDGRGNVTGLVDASSGEQVAKYAYGPFGESVMAVGEAREVCPFRFSTKYFDKATGLHYYGYRYYSASMGRWLNRDPIGEEGGVNVYGFVGNDPVNKWDVLGLAICANKCSQGDRRIVNRDYRIVPNGVAWNAPDSVSALAAGIGALTNTVDLTNILSLSRSATSALASKALEKVEGAVIDATAATAPGNDAESIINNAAQRAFGAGEASRGINVYTVIEYQSCQQESCLIFCKRWNWPEKSTVSVRKCLGGQLLGGTTFISRNISNHVLAKCMAEHVKELNSKNE